MEVPEAMTFAAVVEDLVHQGEGNSPSGPSLIELSDDRSPSSPRLLAKILSRIFFHFPFWKSPCLLAGNVKVRIIDRVIMADQVPGLGLRL